MLGAWFIERRELDEVLGRVDEWKRLLGDGWRLTVLVDYPRAQLVAFGYLDGGPKAERQLELELD